MTIIRWDPFRNISTLQDRINRLFEDAFPHPQTDEVCAWRPLVDIYETEAGVVIQIDLPGVSKEAVSLEVKENVLIIKGDRSSDGDAKEEQYYRRERGCGSFHRAFTLRYTIAPEDIKASMKNGVLKVEIPKPKEEQPHQVRVDIE
jgi:HSP20 family protein